MEQTLLTPHEAKRARASLGLSQNQVSRMAGISRFKLALFEVKKYILSESELKTIQGFYEDQGFVFPVKDVSASSTAKKPSPTHRFKHGLIIPVTIPNNQTDQVLASIDANDNAIATLAQEQAGVDWWTEECKTEGLYEMLKLMATNYHLTCWLTNRDLDTGDQRAEDMKPKFTTNGALVNQLLFK